MNVIEARKLRCTHPTTCELSHCECGRNHHVDENAQEVKVEQCVECTEFFRRYRCGAALLQECDCPRCQGYCECRLLFAPCVADPAPRTDPDVSAAERAAGWDPNP